MTASSPPPSFTTSAEFSAIDLFSARELLRKLPDLTTDETEALTFLLLAQLYWNGLGSTRLSLASKDGDIDRIASLWQVPASFRRTIDQLLLEWRRDSLYGAGRLRELIGVPGEDRPLISDGNFLYLHRHFVAEKRVATLLAERANRAGLTAMEQPSLSTISPTGIELSDEQKNAIARSLEQPLTLVSGGPGTGKTLFIGALCQRWSNRLGAQSICLTAPTGKAVQRLTQTVERAYPATHHPRAETMHRLLGYEPRSGTFAFHEWRRLEGGLFIVDEASMIGLELWLHFLQALPEKSSLVIVGDHQQLPAVAAGDGFRSMLGVFASKRPSATVTLSQNFRVSGGHRALVALADAIKQNQPDRARELLGNSDNSIRHIDVVGTDRLTNAIADWFRPYCSEKKYASPFLLDESAKLRSADVELIKMEMEQWEAAQILCPGRNQPRTGSLAINQQLAPVFAEITHQNASAAYLAWQPVTVQRNDYTLGLFNGDVGLAIPVQNHVGTRELGVVFRRSDRVVVFPLSRVQAIIESSFATTVHKSQGSEYQAVLLVLPESDSPLLHRELLYTAVTRARQQLTVIGSAELFALAVSRSIERSSGLGDALAELL